MRWKSLNASNVDQNRRNDRSSVLNVGADKKQKIKPG